MIYVTSTSYFDIHGPKVFLPQSIGMFVGGMILSMKKIRQLKVNAIDRNIVTGYSWLIANTTLFAVSVSLGVSLFANEFTCLNLRKHHSFEREEDIIRKTLNLFGYIGVCSGCGWNEVF
ncbi:hypothetical protein CYK55_07420 [Enterococcus mundtii]|uniref:GRP family sugar transporter n=1 Tax=Enterococcus mundtii TaxID=53346 RepID=UPI000F7CF6C2|nr:GRP family sugar transporter [Enterococcus mundtii]AZP92938.1 hypothetical protein CYK55_07420 [Enterococcus mundtii]